MGPNLHLKFSSFKTYKATFLYMLMFLVLPAPQNGLSVSLKLETSTCGHFHYGSKTIWKSSLTDELQAVGLDYAHGLLLAHVECTVLPLSMSLAHVLDLKCYFGRMQKEQSNHVILFLFVIHNVPHLLKENRYKEKKKWIKYGLVSVKAPQESRYFVPFIICETCSFS